MRPTAVWAGAGYQLFIICSFLGKNQERFYCRIDLITLDLTVMERMSFNLTSFTPYLFTVDFSCIYLNQSWLLCFKCRGEVGQTSVSPYKTQHSSCFSRPCYQQTFFFSSYYPACPPGPVLRINLFTRNNVFSNILELSLKKAFQGSHGCGFVPWKQEWCLSPTDSAQFTWKGKD